MTTEMEEPQRYASPAQAAIRAAAKDGTLAKSYEGRDVSMPVFVNLDREQLAAIDAIATAEKPKRAKKPDREKVIRALLAEALTARLEDR